MGATSPPVQHKHARPGGNSSHGAPGHARFSPATASDEKGGRCIPTVHRLDARHSSASECESSRLNRSDLRKSCPTRRSRGTHGGCCSTRCSASASLVKLRPAVEPPPDAGRGRALGVPLPRETRDAATDSENAVCCHDGAAVPGGFRSCPLAWNRQYDMARDGRATSRRTLVHWISRRPCWSGIRLIVLRGTVTAGRGPRCLR
jgi:hypothetical protein